MTLTGIPSCDEVLTAFGLAQVTVPVSITRVSGSALAVQPPARGLYVPGLLHRLFVILESEVRCALFCIGRQESIINRLEHCPAGTESLNLSVIQVSWEKARSFSPGPASPGDDLILKLPT